MKNVRSYVLFQESSQTQKYNQTYWTPICKMKKFIWNLITAVEHNKAHTAVSQFKSQ
jgi:hypothetical protein